jgi:hypothetical protein
MREKLLKVRVDVSKVSLAAVATLTMEGCTQFFKGWIKRFGNPPDLFTFPLNETEHPNL